MNTAILILTAFVASIFVALIMALPVELLWNWLCPALFHLPTISFWQALGLCLLARFLFGVGSSSSSSSK